MSDLYDSLEDDSDGNENSRDFLNRPRNESSESFTETYKCDSVDNYSFFLNFDKPLPKQKIDQLFFYNKTHSEEGKFLPKIESNKIEKGLPPVSNLIVDNVALNEKGLQLNKDGSFTRSPRRNEELPFIAREYKNLKFQKKKTYLLARTRLPGKKNSGEKLNLRLKEKSSEAFRTAENSKSLVSSKHFHPKHNMTDSMKERLLRSFEGSKTVLRKYEATGAEQDEKLNRNHSGTKEEKESEGKRLPSQRNILPNLTTTRPRLNYSERRLLENGYNPFCLRQEGKPAPEDSDRSNFGDSVPQELPEISSRVESYENLHDEEEEEEMFYKSLIQKEKALKETPRTCRSDGPVESLKLKGIIRRNSYKDGLEWPSIKSNSRNSAKSTFIDIPADNHSETNSKRFSHYCSTNNTSRNTSKVELALKARTYGYLVNARNIFKLKAQSERKFNALEKGKNEKLNENSNSSTPFPVTLSKQHSLPTNCFKTVKETLIRNLSKQSVSPRNPTLVATKENTRDFVLPQVTSSQFNPKMTPEMFSQINSCLKSE